MLNINFIFKSSLKLFYCKYFLFNLLFCKIFFFYHFPKIAYSQIINFHKIFVKNKKDRKNHRFHNKKIVLNLSHGMHEYEQDRIIKALSKVVPEKWDFFEKLVLKLSKGMDEYERGAFINSLSIVAPEKLNQQFIKMLLHLSVGMDAYEQRVVIESLSKIASEKWELFKKMIFVKLL